MKFIYLEWVDSVGVQGWQRDNTPGLMLVKSAGLLVSETDEYITISTSQHNLNFESPLSIPKVAIMKRKAIKWTP